MTKPASTPDNNPSKLSFLVIIYSNTNQPNAPPLAAITVLINDVSATLLKANALPVLKPYQPIHTKIPPIKAISKL